jgi:hypothetical protein
MFENLERARLVTLASSLLCERYVAKLATAMSQAGDLIFHA